MSTAEEILQKDPGNSIFVEHARNLANSGDKAQAIATLISGLSFSSGNHEARLLLAQIHYELNQLPFAIRELEILRQELPDSEAIRRLLLKLDPRAASTPKITSQADKEETVAEAEFDFEDLEGLDKD